MTEKIQLHSIDIDNCYVPSNTEVYTNHNYISYGSDNNFPAEILRLYETSSIFGSIIRAYIDYVYGDGIITNPALSDLFTNINRDRQNIEDIVRKAIADYIIFGAFALQIMRDKSTGKIVTIYALDVDNCRISKDKDKILYSTQWGKYHNKAISLPMYKPGEVETNSIFYYKSPNTKRDRTYPNPLYISALKDIVIDAKISNYFLNAINNDFSANLMINFNDGHRDEDTQKKIVNEIRRTFGGDGNAGKIMCSFNENKDSAVTIERIDDSQWDKKFETLQKTIRQNIFVAFRITPNLCGLNTEGNGFNNEEYKSSYLLFAKTCITPLQQQIERAFETLFGANAIRFQPFTINFEDNNNQDKNTIINE